MATAIYALTRQGAALALELARGLAADWAATVFLPLRLEPEFGPGPLYFETLAQAMTDNFRRFSGHAVIGAVGLTVRLIAPLLAGKSRDPAVAVLPQNGLYAISLLSGHLGGGNRLAQALAEAAGGLAIISTATDIEGLPALEVLARDHGLAVEDLSPLAYFSRRLVEGEKVAVDDPEGFLRPHLAPWADCFDFSVASGEPRVTVGYRLNREGPRDLVLRPRVVFLGLGCHRGVETGELNDLIDGQLRAAGLAKIAVAALATVENRAEEPALLEISRENGWPLLAFSKGELGRVATPNPSATVDRRIGVPSVCEAAALLAARADRLAIEKKKSRRATLAAALSPAAGFIKIQGEGCEFPQTY